MIINKITYEHKQSSIHAVAAHTRERAESPRKKPRAAHNKLCMTSIRYHFTFISLRWGLSTRKSRVFLPSGGEKEAEKKCSQLRNNIVNRENLSRLTFFFHIKCDFDSARGLRAKHMVEAHAKRVTRWEERFSGERLEAAICHSAVAGSRGFRSPQTVRRLNFRKCLLSRARLKPERSGESSSVLSTMWWAQARSLFKIFLRRFEISLETFLVSFAEQ